MGIKFNADEVLAMAEKIEQNGYDFYAAAAAKAGDDETKKFLLSLAEMEKGHIEVFSKIRASLTEEEKKSATFDPHDEAAMYLEAMADGSVFDKSKSVDEVIGELACIENIFASAIGQEKESIAFYVGLREMLQGKGRDKIDAVIREEMRHVADLSRRYKTIRNL